MQQVRLAGGMKSLPAMMEKDNQFKEKWVSKNKQRSIKGYFKLIEKDWPVMREGLGVV